MKVKLTRTAVDAAGAAEKEYELRDTVVPGFMLRVTPNGRKTCWTRLLERAGVSHVGTHGIRHRAGTEIANSGMPIKVGMQLSAHNTVAQFMQYVHTRTRR